MKFKTDTQQILAGNENQARAKNTGPLTGKEGGVADVIPTKNLDRVRMAGTGHQGEFVNKYFNDPQFRQKTDFWNLKFETGGSPAGMERAQIKMQLGQPLGTG